MYFELRAGILLLLGGLLLALGGCGLLQSKDRIVEVPIATPCLSPDPEQPAWYTLALPKDAATYDRARALIAERDQHLAYETELRAALKACK
jgi:hypothetical protein